MEVQRLRIAKILWKKKSEVGDLTFLDIRSQSQARGKGLYIHRMDLTLAMAETSGDQTLTSYNPAPIQIHH